MTTGDSETEELLRRARAGDTDAVQGLLMKHRGQLHRMISARMDPRLCRRFDPSDVIQETMAVACRELPDYLDRRPCGFYPWLRQIAWQRLAELHRRHIQAQRRSVTREARWSPGLSDGSTRLLAGQLAASGTSARGRMVQQELLARLRSALGQLSPTNREVVVMRHVEQLSLKEIGEVLGISHLAARLRYCRAVERLHDLLKEGSEERP